MDESHPRLDYLAAPIAELAATFDAIIGDSAADLVPSYNDAPTDRISIMLMARRSSAVSFQLRSGQDSSGRPAVWKGE